MLKIYFAGSIRGGRQDKDLYKEIIILLSKFGTVLTEHIGFVDLADAGENIPAAEIFNRDINWLKESDVVVAEVTQPSLGVGYEVATAELIGKKLLCIYRNGEKLSPMVRGNKNILVKEYVELVELDKIFTDFFSN